MLAREPIYASTRGFMRSVEHGMVGRGAQEPWRHIRPAEVEGHECRVGCLLRVGFAINNWACFKMTSVRDRTREFHLTCQVRLVLPHILHRFCFWQVRGHCSAPSTFPCAFPDLARSQSIRERQGVSNRSQVQTPIQTRKRFSAKGFLPFLTASSSAQLPALFVVSPYPIL